MRIEHDHDLRQLLETTRTIALVGISDKSWRPSHQVAAYLIAAGYRVLPVNPALTTVLGQPCFPDLASIGEPIDMVNVFRRADDIGPVVDAAIAVKARSLWLQLGVINEAEAARASAAGLAVVMDRCTKIDHARLLSRRW